MSDCPHCVRYLSGPRAGEVVMRCLVHATAALGGDASSLRAAATVTAFVAALRGAR